MHTTISHEITVCNRAGELPAYGSMQLCQSNDVKTLALRMAWLVKHLNTNPTRLAADSGLSRAHVRNIITEKQESATNETLAKIVKTTGVSARWLQNGDGEPFAKRNEPDDNENMRYPTLWRVLRMFPDRWPGDVVQAAKSIRLDYDGDPEFEAWVVFLDGLKASHESLQREVLRPKGDPTEGLQKRPRF